MMSSSRSSFFSVLTVLLFSVVWGLPSWAGPQYTPVPGSPVADWLGATDTEYPGEHAPLVWRLAHPAPPASLLPPVWQAGLNRLETASGHALKLEMLGGGALYGVSAGVKAIRSGIAEMGTCYTAMESKGFEVTKTFQLPFVAPTNPYLTARIMNELAPTYLRPEFERQGVYPGQFIPTRPLTLMSKTPIRLPTDLKGKKVVSLFNIPDAARLLGFTEVRIPFPEIYTAMQQGIVDAVIWVDMGFIPYRIYEQAKYYTDINLAPTVLETCVNRKRFGQLPKGLKQVVADWQQKMGIGVVEHMERFVREASEIYRKNKVEMISLTDDERRLWREAFLPVREAWLQACDQQHKPCRAMVGEIQALAEKYRSLSDQALMEMALNHPVPGILPVD